jgi:hypothetical protein
VCALQAVRWPQGSSGAFFLKGGETMARSDLAIFKSGDDFSLVLFYMIFEERRLETWLGLESQ